MCFTKLLSDPVIQKLSDRETKKLRIFETKNLCNLKNLTN